MSLASTDFLRPIPLAPHFSPRPWGGERLATALRKQLPPEGGPYGESWEFSDRPEGRSSVAPPHPAAGTPIAHLLRAHPGPLLARDAAPDPLPLLIKYIDAAGDLSVQVHPDDAWCAANNHPDRGKSECWFVLDAAPGTRIQYGFLPGTTPESARAALEQNRFADVLQFLDVRPGDFITVPPRTVHAMLAGILVCEIQQSSNTTFRFHDWDRQPPRELHVEESFAVSEFNTSALPPVRSYGAPGTRPEPLVELLRNEFFRVWMVDLPAGAAAALAPLAASGGWVLNGVAGTPTLEGPAAAPPVAPGETWFLPARMMEAAPSIVAGHQPARLLLSQSLEW